MCYLAAKQDAFEESIRLKNQFRNLDEDEIEFLDSVLESTRAKEEAVKRETTEQLSLFKRQQEEADKLAQAESAGPPGSTAVGEPGNAPTTESEWAINARKRKRAKEKEGLKGVKIRKSSTTHNPPTTARESQSSNPKTTTGASSPPTPSSPSPHLLPASNATAPIKAKSSKALPELLGNEQIKQTKPNDAAIGLGLADYSSDDE